MTIINESTVVVFNSSELKNVLENDNGYTYIYLGANIQLENGIKISSTKVNVTIDGTCNAAVYQYEDKKTLSSGDTITASFPSILKVTVCNMKIVGYNYYGMIYVPENSSYKNIIVEYNNITYVGPQISFHPTGLTRFIDVDITIEDNDLTVGNEVAECNKIEIGGNSTILHNSKPNSAFWFRNTGCYLKILSNANVNFISTYRELFYGVSNLEFSILNNAFFSVTSYNGLAYNNYGTSNTVISTNASFVLKQTNRNGNYATWYSYGSITLNDNSSLSIINNYSNITSSNYNIYFSNAGGLLLNNPKEVVLYNEKANVIYTTSTIPFDFNFSRVNLFTDAINMEDDISLSTLPTYSWYKENGTSEISGTFSSTTVKINDYNYTSEELEKLPDINNFVFANKKIFSLGDFFFRVDALTDTDTSITGYTIPLASILITYQDVNTVITTDVDGKFVYSYDQALPIGTVISFQVKKYHGLLYRSKTIQIVYAGELVLEGASKVVNFKLSPISANPILCPRSSELIVDVIDSRVVSSDWKLYASIKHDLISPEGNVLEDGLVYKDENGDIFTLSDTPTLVYTGKGNDGNTLKTSVTWSDDTGILLMISDKVICDTEYETSIVWTIEE